MAIRLDHTIIPARDGVAAARWFADLFGLAAPIPFSVFWQVTTGNGVDLANPDDHLLAIITIPYGGVAKPG